MSVHATTWVWEQRRWTGNVLLVMLAIADAANREGRGSCQSATTIAAMLGCSRATVFRALKKLEDEGALVRDGVHPKYQTVIWNVPIGLADIAPKEGGSHFETGLIRDAGGVSLVRHNPITTTPPTDEQPVGRASRAPLTPLTHPSRAITADWQPRAEFAQELMREYPGIDLRERCVRFVAFHIAKGDTSRSWEATFRLWASQDWERWSEQQGTDDLGIPKGQRKRKDQPLQPGDPGYVSLDELADAARSVTESERQA